eukprot:Sspe_Gene.6622::Locus_2237_Transcript_2_2_Confidence_0.500_Length_10725::g.6622::m.6622
MYTYPKAFSLDQSCSYLLTSQKSSMSHRTFPPTGISFALGTRISRGVNRTTFTFSDMSRNSMLRGRRVCSDALMAHSTIGDAPSDFSFVVSSFEYFSVGRRGDDAAKSSASRSPGGGKGFVQSEVMTLLRATSRPVVVMAVRDFSAASMALRIEACPMSRRAMSSTRPAPSSRKRFAYSSTDGRSGVVCPLTPIPDNFMSSLMTSKTHWGKAAARFLYSHCSDRERSASRRILMMFLITRSRGTGSLPHVSCMGERSQCDENADDLMPVRPAMRAARAPWRVLLKPCLHGEDKGRYSGEVSNAWDDLHLATSGLCHLSDHLADPREVETGKLGEVLVRLLGHVRLDSELTVHGLELLLCGDQLVDAQCLLAGPLNAVERRTHGEHVGLRLVPHPLSGVGETAGDELIPRLALFVFRVEPPGLSLLPQPHPLVLPVVLHELPHCFEVARCSLIPRDGVHMRLVARVVGVLVCRCTACLRVRLPQPPPLPLPVLLDELSLRLVLCPARLIGAELLCVKPRLLAVLCVPCKELSLSAELVVSGVSAGLLGIPPRPAGKVEALLLHESRPRAVLPVLEVLTHLVQHARQRTTVCSLPQVAFHTVHRQQPCVLRTRLVPREADGPLGAACPVQGIDKGGHSGVPPYEVPLVGHTVLKVHPREGIDCEGDDVHRDLLLHPHHHQRTGNQWVLLRQREAFRDRFDGRHPVQQLQQSTDEV